MSDPIFIDAKTLQQWLADDSEIALLDIREAGIFGEGHLLLSSNLPYSQLETKILQNVPRLNTRLVLLGEPDIDALAARRLIVLGYSNVHVLSNGIEAWKSAGYPLFPSIHVPSKAFAEFVEHAFHTPALTAQTLQNWRDEGRPYVLLDGRTVEEFARYHVPGARHCANADLVLRFVDLVPSGEIPVIVSCAGRTRGIMGAQTLISAGVPNPVYSLSGGTQGWKLSGQTIASGPDTSNLIVSPEGLSIGQQRARALADRLSIRRIDAAGLRAWRHDTDRTTYFFDVRSPEEFRQRHLPGTLNVPGGQLIQTLDRWVSVRRARIVLVDDLSARADVTAYWLTQLGWEVAVLEDVSLTSAFESNASNPSAVGQPDQSLLWPQAITLAEARTLLASGAQVIDAGSSADYQRSRLGGAIWLNRSRLHTLPSSVSAANVLLITGAEASANRLAAQDLIETYPGKTVLPIPGTAEDWRAAGLLVDEAPVTLSDATRIDYLFWLHQRHTGNAEQSRAYLAWEESLVLALTPPETAGFQLRPTA